MKKIEQRFEQIVREEMTEKEFWGWVEGWFDIDVIVDIALNWEVREKKDFVEEWERNHKKKVERRVSVEDLEMLERENKAMAGALKRLGYSSEEISDIANGAL